MIKESMLMAIVLGLEKCKFEKTSLVEMARIIYDEIMDKTDLDHNRCKGGQKPQPMAEPQPTKRTAVLEGIDDK